MNMLPSRMFFDSMLDEIDVSGKSKCDIYELDNKVYIEMDVPGFNKDSIKLEYNKGNIVIKAECKNEEKDDKKYLHRERKTYSKIERSFHLEDIDEETLEAQFKDGILKISVDKISEDRNKKVIEIK